MFSLGWPDISARYNAIGRFAEYRKSRGGCRPVIGKEQRGVQELLAVVNIIAGHWLLWGASDYAKILRYVTNIGNSIRHIR